MPSFTTVLQFLAIWTLLSFTVFGVWVILVLISERINEKKEATPQTLIQRFHDDTLIINFYIFGEDPEPTERIFSVDSSGETICSRDGTILATAYLVDEDPVEFYVYPSITVDDSESHDMFRNNAGVNQL